jgi:accessory gene regulator B
VTKIAESAVSYLIDVGSVSENDRDIYEYGFLLLASLAVNLVVTAAIGFVFRMPLELLCMFVPFVALRTVSGGYHAESFGGCVAASGVAIAVATAAIKFTPESARNFTAATLSAFTFAVAFALAPVSHPNRSLDAGEIHKFRRQARVVAVAAIVVSQVLFLTRAPLYGFCISIGIALSGAATLVAALRERGGEHDEEEI